MERIRTNDVIELSADQHGAIAGAWLERTLAAYPAQTSRFLMQEQDRFRNPVGYAFRNGLPVLLRELLGEMNAERITPVLDEIMRMRAVQDFAPSGALGFLLVLKDVLRESHPHLAIPEVERRIDALALQAFDLYVDCRERMCEIRTREANRRSYVPDRMQAGSVP